MNPAEQRLIGQSNANDLLEDVVVDAVVAVANHWATVRSWRPSREGTIANVVLCKERRTGPVR
jgi:hypothetical protein